MAQFVPFLCDKNTHIRIHTRTVTDLGEQPHYHDCYQILYVQTGRMLHQQVVLQPGDCFIVPPGYVHHTKADGGDLRYCSLTFRPALFSPGFVTSPAHEFLDNLRMTRHEARLRIRLPKHERKRMEQLFELLLDECSACDPQTTMSGHLVAAILRIASRCHKPDAEVPIPDPIEACRRYIDANYMLPLTPDGLARQFALSRSALMDRFPKTAGLPVKQYLHRRRIEQAKKLLQTVKLSVREVSKLVGYEDFSTFYRNFKKYTDQSPAQYRTIHT